MICLAWFLIPRLWFHVFVSMIIFAWFCMILLAWFVCLESLLHVLWLHDFACMMCVLGIIVACFVIAWFCLHDLCAWNHCCMFCDCMILLAWFCFHEFVCLLCCDWLGFYYCIARTGILSSGIISDSWNYIHGKNIAGWMAWKYVENTFNDIACCLLDWFGFAWVVGFDFFHPAAFGQSFKLTLSQRWLATFNCGSESVIAKGPFPILGRSWWVVVTTGPLRITGTTSEPWFWKCVCMFFFCMSWSWCFFVWTEDSTALCQ